MENPIVRDILSGKKPKPIALIVDDEKIVLDSFSEISTKSIGKLFSTFSASSGEQALEMVKNFSEQKREIGIIISDQIMPGMKGDDFLIEAHKLVPNAIKIMLSGQAESISVGKALNYANLYRYLDKTSNDQIDIQRTIEEAAKSFFNQLVIESQQKTLKSLHDTSLQLLYAKNFSTLFKTFLENLEPFIQFHLFQIVKVQSEQHFLAAINFKGNIEIYNQPNQIINLPQDIINYLINEKKVATNVQFNRQTDAKSWLIYPIFDSENTLKAYFIIEHPNPNFYDLEELQNFFTLSIQFSTAYENLSFIDSLEEKIQTRTQYLTETLEKLLAVNSHKDKMIQIVSHDIRSPISGVAELAGFLTNPSTAEDKEKVMRYAKLIQQEANNVVKFVSDLLDLAKLESGTILVNKEKTSLTKFLKEMALRFEPQSITKQIQLITDLSQEIECPFDINKLQMAIGNILSNAFKFTPKGGKVTLSLNKDNHFAKISIADTGIGIPKEDLGKIFEKFGVKQRKGTAGEKGTGLGMSIAWQIVQLHGGIIEVNSEVGKGTNFIIYIPLEN
jgi:signal transduction histidine kinase/DNA-binding NarL/FixJ family response regulator